jgi:CRP-like cAMP-binding protein
VLFVPSRSDDALAVCDIRLFAGCIARELRRIDRLGTKVTIDARRVLCRRGDLGRQCFVILDGVVEVATADAHHVADRGAVIGELALLVPNGRSTATVVAASDVTALVFTRTEFRQLMGSIPTVAHRILREAARRLITTAPSD